MDSVTMDSVAGPGHGGKVPAGEQFSILRRLLMRL